MHQLNGGWICTHHRLPSEERHRDQRLNLNLHKIGGDRQHPIIDWTIHLMNATTAALLNYLCLAVLVSIGGLCIAHWRLDQQQHKKQHKKCDRDC